ncbi:hypothetical protein [Actinomyces faecalis]|uniref:hypothetical protein n=1 Tax=Actinomyces faecalis TaxID=2722820 RepID=UPI0015526083|nr:hypothetical protein [Actinomyces faecalis]
MPSGSRSVGAFGEAVAAILKGAAQGQDTRLQVIGDHVSLSVAQISRMLNGQKVITLDEYVGMCEVLHLDPKKIIAEARLALAPAAPAATNDDSEARLAEAAPAITPHDFDWDAEIARNLREREEAARVLATYDLAANEVDDSVDDDNANV